MFGFKQAAEEAREAIAIAATHLKQIEPVIQNLNRASKNVADITDDVRVITSFFRQAIVKEHQP